jgi:hypothetical protein
MRWLHRCALVLTVCPSVALSQIPAESTVRPELRADAIMARVTHLQSGFGFGLRTGYNLRAHIALAGGVALRDGLTRESARGDATLRLLLDPYGETHAGLSIGGGLSIMHDGFEDTRPVGVIVIGIEGNARAARVWALEVGLGSGARIGVILRPRATRTR